MKTVAYTALHYGREYLSYAIRSVIDAVDEYWVFYSPVGSHGSRTETPCPETIEELYDLARRAAGDKLHWRNGRWTSEGAQREMILEAAPDADLILVLDADEIWPDGCAAQALRLAAREDSREFRLPMIHFWRSFYRAIVHDPAFPVRIVQPRASARTEQTLHTAPLCHMGYAQSARIVGYKQLVHGHRGQWRQDRWFERVFLNPQARSDLHPVGSDYWTWEPVDPWRYLPTFMREHPYAALEVIP